MRSFPTVVNLIDKKMLAEIALGVEKDALARKAVAARAARLPDNILKRLGKIGVNDEAYIGLVDSHAKGDRRDDDGHLVTDEFFLRFLAYFWVSPAW